MIDTNRLIIRKFTIEDGQDLFEYLSLVSTYQFEPGEPIDLASAKNLAIDRSNADNFYAVVLKNEDKMIGHLYFQQIEPMEFMTWELGYVFNPMFQNQGYASEASKALVEYAFQNLKAHRVVAHCSPKNIASWKLLEKIGMQREGYQRKNVFFRKNDAGEPIWLDTYDYGFLVSDI